MQSESERKKLQTQAIFVKVALYTIQTGNWNFVVVVVVVVVVVAVVVVVVEEEETTYDAKSCGLTWESAWEALDLTTAPNPIFFLKQLLVNS